MKQLFALAKKDLRLLSLDPIGMFFLLGFPILMGLFVGSMMGSVGSPQNNALEIAVVDRDSSRMSAAFVENLQKIDAVKVIPLPDAEARDRVRKGQIVGMIIVPEGFGETAGILWREPATIQVGLDPSRRAEAGMLQGFVMQAMGQLVFLRFQDPASFRPWLDEARQAIQEEDLPATLRPALTLLYDSLDDVIDSLTELQDAAEEQDEEDASDAPGGDLGDLQLARIEQVDVTREIDPDSPRAVAGKLRSRWDISFPQASIWGVLGCAAGFAVTIVRERTRGTFLRLQVAPISRGLILAGKGLACFTAVLGVLAVMVGLGMLLGMRPRSLPLLFVASVSIAYCFVGIMMLMSVVGKTEEAVGGAAWGANVLMAMFGGGMVPLAFMPPFLRTISHFDPVKWCIYAMEGAIWRGFSMAEMLLPVGILLAVGTVTMSLGVWRLSRQRD